MAVTLGHGKLTGRGNTFTPISSSYSDIASISEITHIENGYGWQTDLEPTAGNYDFSKIGTDLDYLYAQGGTKKLGISLPWGTFNGKERFMPSGGHWGGLGVAFVEAANGARILRVWDSTIRTKMKNTITALKTYLNSHAHKDLVAYIVGSETAANNFGGEPVSASTWQSVLLDYHQHLCTQMSGITEIRVKAQYSLASVEQFARDLYTAGVRIFGGPDIDPYNGGNYNIALMYARLAEEYGSSFVVGYNFEWANYLPTTPTRSFTFPADYPDATLAGTTTSNTVGNAALDADFFLHIINYAVNVQRLGIITWLPRTGSSTAGQPDLGWTDGVLPAIQNAASTAIFPYGESSPPPPPPPPPSSTLWELKPARKALPTATGAFAIAHGCASTPKAVFLHSDTATADDTNSNGSMINYGATDGTRQWAISLRATTGVTAGSYCAARGMTDQSHIRLLGGSNNVDGEMAFSSFDSTNVNFTCGDAYANASFVNMLAAAGDGASAYAGKVSLTTQNTATTVTPGWTLAANEILLGIVVTTDITWNDTGVSGGAHSLGFFTFDGTTVKQMCRSSRAVDSTYNTSMFSNLHSTRVGQIIATGGTETFALEVSADTTTISFTPRNGNANSDIGIFVVKLSGAVGNLIVDNLPIAADLSGGLYSHNVAQATDFALFLNTLLTSTDSIASDATAGSFGFSIVAPNQSYTIQSTRQDNVATTNCRSRAAQKPVYLYEHSGSTKHYDATMSSVTNPADKITLAYGTIVPTTRTKAIIAAVARVSQINATLTSVTVPTTIDLSSNSTDYIRLGAADTTTIERKANGGNQVSVSWNNAPVGRFGGGSTNYPQFSATDSAPSGSLVASAARLYWGTVGDIVTFVVPANTETANFKAWINASGVDVDITVEDSSGVLSDFTDSLTSADTTNGNIQRGLLDVDFVSNASGSSIVVTAEITAVNATGGNMSVQAGVLLNNYTPPADTTNPDFPFGFPRLVSQTETSPGSGLYDVVIGVQLSEPGEVFGVIFPSTNTSAPSPQQCESGTDGNDSTTGRVGYVTNTPIDTFEEVFLTFEDVPEDADYVAYIAAIDNASPSGNYCDASYAINFTTPSGGSGGGEGTYSATTGVIRSNGNAVVNTAIVYSWVEDDVGEYSTSTFVDGTGTTSSTGTFTITRPTTNQGRIIISDAATGTKIWTEVLTPA